MDEGNLSMLNKDQLKLQVFIQGFNDDKLKDELFKEELMDYPKSGKAERAAAIHTVLSGRVSAPGKPCQGKRQQCDHCNGWKHLAGSVCPAINGSCNKDGARGHFAHNCGKDGYVKGGKKKVQKIGESGCFGL